MEDIFKKRRQIMLLACENLREIIRLQNLNSSLDDLLNFHRRVFNLEIDSFSNSTTQELCKPPKRARTNLFLVKNYTNLAACLPPKRYVERQF